MNGIKWSSHLYKVTPECISLAFHLHYDLLKILLVIEFDFSN